MVKNPPANAGRGKGRGSSLGWEDPLEAGTATPSSALAWRIQWAEEPGRLQSMGVAESQTPPKRLSMHAGRQRPQLHVSCRCPIRRPSEAVDVPYSEEDTVVMETAQVQIGLR